MGSLAFIAAARAAFAVTKDPQDPTGERRLVLPIKHNLGNDKTGLAYRLVGLDGSVPAVSWEREPVTQSADDILNADRRAGGNDSGTTERDEAAAWLCDALSDGPAEAKDLIVRSKEDGIHKRTLDRAKHDLGVIAYREGFGAAGAWHWKLPDVPGCDRPAIECHAQEDQSPTPDGVATFGQVGNLWENPKKNGPFQGGQGPPIAKGCQGGKAGNLSTADDRCGPGQKESI